MLDGNSPKLDVCDHDPRVRRMNLSVIIPAFNEADYLPATLESIQQASEHLQARADVDVEVIVVDNNSTDDTAAIAGAMGARAVHESVQGIGRARNCGASAAQGDVLLFTNPLFIALFRRWKAVWSDWYRRPVR